MQHGRSKQRSLGRTLYALFQLTYHVFAPWRRKWRVRWGARSEEPAPSLLGEDLIPDPTWDYTHAVSVDAPPERVWPWIAQMGQGRGGFYSFERLENILGCHIENADTIIPELQVLDVGDEIRLHPTSPAMQVVAIEPGRSLVLSGAPIEDELGETDNLWAFHVLPDGPGRSRVVERGKTLQGPSFADRLFFSPLLIEPIGFVMSREMLLGIKERAEAL